VETAPSYTADYLDNPPPPYPRLSRQLGEEGTALLKVEVGPDGRALQVRLLSSTGYSRLDEAAITTVERWRFVAATRNGQAVASWVLVPIKFRIIN
jgi:protein TonB